jgi:hypothetical protein
VFSDRDDCSVINERCHGLDFDFAALASDQETFL